MSRYAHTLWIKQGFFFNDEKTMQDKDDQQWDERIDVAEESKGNEEEQVDHPEPESSCPSDSTIIGMLRPAVNIEKVLNEVNKTVDLWTKVSKRSKYAKLRTIL